MTLFACGTQQMRATTSFFVTAYLTKLTRAACLEHSPTSGSDSLLQFTHALEKKAPGHCPDNARVQNGGRHGVLDPLHASDLHAYDMAHHKHRANYDNL